MSTLPVWLVGCGNMAGAMLEGWLRTGEPASRFHVLAPRAKGFPDGVSWTDTPPEGGFGEAIVQLGVKPYMLGEIATQYSAYVGEQAILTSILAGVELESLCNAFPDAGAIVRVMPNTPVALGRGAVALAAKDRTSEAAQAVETLSAKLGLAEWIEDEALFDAVTALSGSGPAFLFRFVDSLAKAGAELGLDGELAMRLALATVDGAAGLAVESEDDPGALADKVASPGGSTRKGLDVLDEGGALDRLLLDTLKAAEARNKEMAEEARG